jgi:cytochrome c biogenesis protein CcdA
MERLNHIHKAGDFMSWNEWYLTFSQLTNSLVDSIYQLSNDVSIPILVALLLGLAGATAPCQISTNIGAIGYVARYSKDGNTTINQALSFVGGKMAAYLIIGGTTIFLGTQMETVSENLIPVVEVIRKAMGPLFVISGLVMLGVFRFQRTIGENVKDKLLQYVPKRGAWGAFLLGIVFSLAFCPTLFLLFFGMLVPLGIRSTGGIFFPAVFAIGTALPLLLLSYLMAIGSDTIRKRFVKQAGKINRLVTKIVAVIFILLGLNDTFLYWML